MIVAAVATLVAVLAWLRVPGADDSAVAVPIRIDESAVPPERLAAYRDAVAAIADAHRRAEGQFASEESAPSMVGPTDDKDDRRSSKRSARAVALEDELLAEVAVKHGTTAEALRRMLGRFRPAGAGEKKPTVR